MPLIDKECSYCKKTYKCERHRQHKSTFCSIDCANLAQRRSERREVPCESCGNLFTSMKDHGKWMKFCDRTCFLQGSVKPEPRECKWCESLFMALASSHSEDGLRAYCSRQCYHQSQQKREDRVCLNCGITFQLAPSQAAQRPDQSCCGMECRREYYKASLHPGWEGGHYMSEFAGYALTFLQRKDYVGKYIQDHRLAASKALGRMVERGEVVIHINRNKMDNRTRNLFVCGSMSEYAKIRSGSLPWPAESNIVRQSEIS
jgi:hypothetical protein